jgi:Cdc25 family phosphatase
MSSDSKIKFVEPEEVAEWLRAGQVAAAGSASDAASVAIVDVRDEDFAGGHIPGAHNVPSAAWESDTENTAAAVLAAHGQRRAVVFHCMQSRVRGPSCAARFSEYLEQQDIQGEQRPEVYVVLKLSRLFYLSKYVCIVC